VSTSSTRRNVVSGIIIIFVSIFVVRLFTIQIADNSYQMSANNNSRRYMTDYAARGVVFDRNGKLLVYNQPAYDLMVIPNQTAAFDTAELASLIKVKESFLKDALKKARSYSRFKPSVVVKEIGDTTFVSFNEQLYKFPGFFTQMRTLRKYPNRIASHILGYIGEVDDRVIKDNTYYAQGDYIGISGIERSYEEQLRGRKGVRIFLVDVHNRIQGGYQDGKYDTLAVSGKNITTTLDAELQAYGEYLLQKKTGAIVAIEPSTGEILALVSAPTYDPNLLVGRVRSPNYRILVNDKNKPLFNRALMAQYPPGSTFKLVNALIGLQEKVITPGSVFTCAGGYHMGSLKVGCHHNGSIDFLYSIQGSCNAYYCNVYQRTLDDKKYKSVAEAYLNWRKYVTSFGLGVKLNTDLAHELEGLVPTNAYFDRYYGKNRWKSLMLISMSIGQGELGVTPVQMANMVATIANRGYYFIPHIVKNIEGQDKIDPRFMEKHFTNIDTSYFELVIEGMARVVTGGTATNARVSDIEICGKTGTAQNPHGEDHSIFVAFAPRHNPKIAIAVYVENAGFGSTWASPVASLMIEKYLKGSISRPDLEKYIADKEILIVKK